MALTPDYPPVNKSFKYVSGGRLSFLTSTTISVAAGAFRDSQNINDIVLGSAVTINAATNGANGLDTGALANSTKYAVYAIASSKAGDSTSDNYIAPAGLLSTSFTAPSLPFGYDMFRRIGCVFTSGAAAILDFTQKGNGVDRPMWYAASIATPITAGASTTFATVVATGFVPTTAGEFYLLAVLTADAGATRTAAFRDPNSTSAAGQVVMSSPASTVTSASLVVPCATIAGVVSCDYLVSNASAAIALNVEGYLDQL